MYELFVSLVYFDKSKEGFRTKELQDVKRIIWLYIYKDNLFSWIDSLWRTNALYKRGKHMRQIRMAHYLHIKELGYVIEVQTCCLVIVFYLVFGVSASSMSNQPYRRKDNLKKYMYN
ncbi:hypothetical protein P8452_02520 [Trifolium repens]|nr:hypothetical protein P8452_02520 [Trifolium repens]